MTKITLKAARVNVGLSQVEAAEKLNVSLATLKNWEAGRNYPRQPQIEDMCALYSVEYSDLSFGRNKKRE